MKNSQTLRSDRGKAAACGSIAMFAAVVFLSLAMAPNQADAAPAYSTTIALTSDETRVVVVNREENTVSIIQIKDANGNDVANKLDEIRLGEEPQCVGTI
jgi:hypothetical protein